LGSIDEGGKKEDKREVSTCEWQFLCQKERANVTKIIEDFLFL
jgi:hypothetical protein